jgi:glycosyltransferase involved in cell wall biosynthesis
MQKSIFIFTQSLKSGGAEKQSVLLANTLSKDYNISLIVFYPEKKDNRITNLINNNIKVIYLTGNKLGKIIQLFRITRLYKPYIIFNYLLLPNFIGGFISMFFKNTKSIGGIRSSKLDSKKETINRLLNNYLNYKTIFNNHNGYNFYINRGFKKNKALVIPNAIETENKEIIRDIKNIPTILSVGRFHIAKDYYTAIKTISLLYEKGLLFRYKIIGWGDEEENIREWIKEFNLKSDLVEIIINPDNINYYYKEADIYLQTSIFEGVSNTVLEAMSYSLPLVITNVGDNNKLTDIGINGYLTEPKDSFGISEKLEILLNNYDKRISFGKNSFKKLYRNYSIKMLEEKYKTLINSIIKK